MPATSLESMALPLGIAAVVALLGWLIVLILVSVANRPNRPEPASAGLELGGASPPAVAAMLTNRWKPSRVGPTATLVDLAARDLVHFESMAEGGFQVRVPEQPPPTDLLDYEVHVLALVRSRASNGVVPCAALQVREQAPTWTSSPLLSSTNVKVFSFKTTNWFKKFNNMVATDARRRGLSRARFSHAATLFVGATAAVAAGLVGLAVVALPSSSDASSCATCSRSSDNPLVGTVAIGFFVWIGLMVVFSLLKDDRDTPDGLAEAGRWLGLRGNLRNDPVFGEQHVDAVAVWDRLLAFGVALGVAHVAADDVPISAESKDEAWSAESGQWRFVHIDYPKRMPPGYGMPTWLTFVRGALNVMIAILVLFLGVPFVMHFTNVFDANPDQLSGSTNSAADTALHVVAAAMAVIASLFIVRGLVMLWFAVTDFGANREVEGLVLRSYAHSSSNDQDWWEAAVDDGTSDRVRAWRGTGQLPPELQEGNRVRATITRHLCTFKSAEVLSAQPTPYPPATPQPTANPIGPTGAISAPAMPSPPMPLPTIDPSGSANTVAAHPIPPPPPAPHTT